MQILVTTDRSTSGSDQFTAHVRHVVTHALAHVADQLTRVEVHLGSDQGAPHGAPSQRCVIEARLRGLEPTAVTHHAANLHEALDGAADRLRRALDHAIDRRQDHHRGD